MEFRTKVELPVNVPLINHSDRLMLWGSCFAENIGKLFIDNKFRCDVNPFGVLYNPLSIANALGQVLCHKRYEESDLKCERGVWLSLMHHGSFSSGSAEECLKKINARIRQAEETLAQTQWMIFTWGTSWVYEWKETGEVVGNCHKLPERLFNRYILKVEDIVEAYGALIERLLSLNPRMHCLFTVSPIRHIKDGMHGNQVSKAVLLLAIQRLTGQYPSCLYFPSYEIMMDELRDYRFYADDMLHPSSVAVDYLWECFGKTFFSPSARSFLDAWEKVKKALAHRPFDAESEQYRRFLSQILLNIEELKEKFTYLDVQNEIELCQARLKK